MWTYEQASGAIVRPDGSVLAIGYSGRVPDGKNRPDTQHIRNVGPIPRGWYTIEAPRTSTFKKYYMPLAPRGDNEMFGRSGFQIHGDNASGDASTGCIIISPKSFREEIWNSGDHLLRVVETSVKVTAAKLRHAPLVAFIGSTREVEIV